MRVGHIDRRIKTAQAGQVRNTFLSREHPPTWRRKGAPRGPLVPKPTAHHSRTRKPVNRQVLGTVAVSLLRPPAHTLTDGRVGGNMGGNGWRQRTIAPPAGRQQADDRGGCHGAPGRRGLARRAERLLRWCRPHDRRSARPMPNWFPARQGRSPRKSISNSCSLCASLPCSSFSPATILRVAASLTSPVDRCRFARRFPARVFVHAAFRRNGMRLTCPITQEVNTVDSVIAVLALVFSGIGNGEGGAPTNNHLGAQTEDGR